MTWSNGFHARLHTGTHIGLCCSTGNTGKRNLFAAFRGENFTRRRLSDVQDAAHTFLFVVKPSAQTASPCFCESFLSGV